MKEVEPIRSMEQVNALRLRLGGRNRLMFTLGLNLALRISDLLRITWGDLLFRDEAKQLKVKEHLRITERKTRKTRKMAINEKAYLAITDYLVKQKFDIKMTERVIAISRIQAYRILKKAAKEVGIKELIGTHTLRKTWGYHARVTFKMSVEQIQKKLGHYTPGVTMRYIGLSADEIEKVEKTVQL